MCRDGLQASPRRPDAAQTSREGLCDRLKYHAWDLAKAYLLLGEEDKAHKMLTDLFFSNPHDVYNFSHADKAAEVLSLAAGMGASDFSSQTFAHILDWLRASMRKRRPGRRASGFDVGTAGEICRTAALLDARAVRRDDELRRKTHQLWDEARRSRERM